MEQVQLAEKERQILAVVRDLCSQPIFCWSTEKADTSKTAVHQGFSHPCEVDGKLCSQLEQSMANRSTPVLFFENEFVYYGVMRWADGYACLGPAVRTSVTKSFEAQYSAGHGVKPALPLAQCDTGTMTKVLALLACVSLERAVSYDEITLCGPGYAIDSWYHEGELEKYQLAQSENERGHNSGIDFEAELIEIIRRGDTDAVKNLLVGQMPDMNKVSSVAKSQQRQAEYLTVSLVTLLTRAAIEGGVNSEKAHEMGDVFLRQLETASLKGEAFTMIGYRAMYDFTALVRQIREQKQKQSTIIEACKDYIAKHLRKELEVSEIAPAIGVSRTHLAHKFKEVEGITVQQFIQRERCRHAANLLQYSDYPISIIAEYMCFSSQSYFGSCFKQWYGMTPNEYRLQNQKL